ncbi:hypothetical protein SASPL_122766 [Salvia splendens]|uniref:Uncharacterized protein n=1 Tax=Salvia splendens TaxID=180675 RepID=A0A8X8XNL8_SALSN|nr:hypothetical protein SASPL_122766 [Salvia splendens]
MSALTSSSLFNSHSISRFPSSFSHPTSYSIRIGFPIKIPRIRASSNELDIKTDQQSVEDVQEPDNDLRTEKGSNNSSGTTPALDKDLKKAKYDLFMLFDSTLENTRIQVVQKTAATFAPRASTASKNPAVPGTVLYTVFEVQGYASLLLGGALSFNLVFPSNEPDLWRLMGMWSIWMFTIPSLRARDCSKNEKEALNYLFLLVPLLNVTIPFFLKSFAVVWSADVVAFFGISDGFLRESRVGQQCGMDTSYSFLIRLPIVRNISEMAEDSYGLPGFSHITIAGSIMHGFKEVEVWHQTLGPGAGTPIHRHSCEEIFVVLEGSGTLYLASNSHLKHPGTPQHFPFSSNSTFHIPVDNAHQVVNTNQDQHLKFLVVISKPPMKLFVYDDWFVPHIAAKLLFPVFWDEKSYQTPQVNDEL